MWGAGEWVESAFTGRHLLGPGATECPGHAGWGTGQVLMQGPSKGWELEAPEVAGDLTSLHSRLLQLSSAHLQAKQESCRQHSQDPPLWKARSR